MMESSRDLLAESVGALGVLTPNFLCTSLFYSRTGCFPTCPPPCNGAWTAVFLPPTPWACDADPEALNPGEFPSSSRTGFFPQDTGFLNCSGLIFLKTQLQTAERVASLVEPLTGPA